MATKPRTQVEEEVEEERPSFSSILEMPASEATRPPPYPQGTYLTMIKGHFEEIKSSKKGTTGFKFTHQLLEAQDDVDPDALKVVLTDRNGNVMPLREKVISNTLWDSPKAAFMLRDYLVALGVEEEDEEGNPRRLGDMIQEAPGRQCYVHITHKPTLDGQGIFAQIDQVIKVT